MNINIIHALHRLRVLLKSRKVFSNWFFVGIKYTDTLFMMAGSVTWNSAMRCI